MIKPSFGWWRSWISLAALLLASLASAQNPYVTVNGTLQGPNGLPVANGEITFTPSQLFFVAGLGSSSCSGYIIEIGGLLVPCGNTVNFNNTTPAAPANGLNVQWQASSGPTTNVSAAIVGDGNSSHCLTGVGTWANCGVGQIANAIVTLGAVQITGPSSGAAPTLSSSSTNNFPTATHGWSYTWNSAASASTSTVVGYSAFTNGNNSSLGILPFSIYSQELAIGNLTNARYWFGLGNWNIGSGTGVNNLAILGTTAYAADLPNKTTIAFRYSAGTDTDFQACSLVATNPTVQGGCVSTGVAADTNTHLFQMSTNAAGTSVAFFIDGVSVATISSNLPNPASNYDSLASMFLTGDNKNTATAVSATFYGASMGLKQ